eukprot:4997337-Prymnesium_polylepis.1
MWELDDDEATAATSDAAARAPAPPRRRVARRPAAPNEFPVTTIPNLRDVASADPSLLRPGVLLRCGTPDFCSAVDAQKLIELGVRTRIDLRHEREMAVACRSRWFRDANLAPRQCSDALRRRAEIESHHLFVDGRPRYTDAASAAAATDEASVAAQGVAAAGTGAAPANLPMVQQYLAFTELSAKALGGALRAIVDAPTATLVHCTAGKDRTGVVCAFVLLLCGIPLAAVCTDYERSHGVRTMFYDSGVADPNEPVLCEMDEDGPQLGAAAATMAAFVEALRRRHGSVEAWLDERAGFGASAVRALRQKMLRARAKL